MVEGDHPRIRGEHSWFSPSIRISGGSSPHTRGARIIATVCDDNVRIIPAYAGSTVRRRRLPRNPWDHPRIRGEHCCALMDFAVFQGSSPHTRGAPKAVWDGVCRAWIIPAYAGSTARVGNHSLSTRDHPRIRGEHIHARAGHRFVSGSSPHTRGARYREIGFETIDRIIPAYAGSTSASRATSRPTTDHPRIRGEHAPSEGRERWSVGSSPHTRGARSSGRR